MRRWRSVCSWLNVPDSWIPVTQQARTSPRSWAWPPNSWWSSCLQRRSIRESSPSTRSYIGQLLFWLTRPCSIFFTRICKEWSRVYQNSWRNTSKKRAWASSLTISPNGVKQLKELQLISLHATFILFVLKWWSGCFVTSCREWEWGSEDEQVVSSVGSAGEREEKDGESEGDLQGEHGSSAKTDRALPHCKCCLVYL